MGRHGYQEDIGDWASIRWRGMVASSIRGRRGQAFLRELAKALDAMPEKRLVAEDLKNEEGDVCTLGAALAAKGLDPAEYDPEDHEGLAQIFDIAPCLVQEVEYENDDSWLRKEDYPDGLDEDERRWHRMRRWVDACLAKGKVGAKETHDGRA